MAPTPSYYVIMKDLGRLGLEAIVHPEDTRSNVIDKVREILGDGIEIPFIHFVEHGFAEDVTEEILEAASALRLEAAE